ncbi:MAG: cupin, partial [Mesorhizobium sp.]
MSSKPTCHLIRPENSYEGKQGLSYFTGIAAETVGSIGICM